MGGLAVLEYKVRFWQLGDRTPEIRFKHEWFFFWPQLPSKITLEITIFGKLWGKLLTGSDVNLLLFKNYNPLLVQLFQCENFFNISSGKYKKNF